MDDVELNKALKAYSKRLKLAIQKDPNYKIFAQATKIDVKNKTTQQISNIIKRLDDTKFDTTKREKFGNITVSSDVLAEMRRRVAKVNQAHAEIRKLYPEVSGTKVQSVRKARWSDIDIGTGENQAAFSKRLESIINYSTPERYKQEGIFYRRSYIQNLEANLGPYADRIIKLLPRDGNIIYALTQSEEYGDYLTQEYIYTDDDMRTKAQNIENALRRARGIKGIDYDIEDMWGMVSKRKPSNNEKAARRHAVNYYSARDFVNKVYGILGGF